MADDHLLTIRHVNYLRAINKISIMRSVVFKLHCINGYRFIVTDATIDRLNTLWMVYSRTGNFPSATSFLKENTPSRVVRGGRSLAGNRRRDSDAWCLQVISRLPPPDERLFSFYTVLRLLLWRRRSEIFRSAFLLRDPPCSTTCWWIT